MVREIPARKLRPGLHLEVDRVAPPDDPDDYASVFEQVVMIEELGPTYLVHTENRDVYVIEEGNVTVEEDEDADGDGDGVPPAAAGE